MEGTRSTRIVRFGVFEVDLNAGELRRNGRKIKLQEQPFEILSLLLDHPGEVVTQEEVIAKLWPDGTVVEYEPSIRTAVRKLRHALDDDADTPRYVETLQRRGYRFVYPVNGFGASPGVEERTSGAGGAKRSHWLLWVPAVVAFASISAAIVFTFNIFRMRDRFLGETRAPQIQSLAVLPLVNLSGDPAQEYFSDGMTDALITDLAQIGSLKLISRTSIMRYKKTDKTLPEIARELNVDAIVEGTVQRSGDRVRITANLIHGPSDKHLWASRYERDLRDIFALEQEVTDDIASQVRARIATRDQPLSVQPRPVNVEALEAYLQGNFHLNKSDMAPRDEELRKAGEYFQHAIDADPTFVSAYIGLTEAHHNLWWPGSEDFAIMRASAAKALELAPTSSDAHRALGMTKFEDWDWIGAEKECRRAIALNPNNAAAHDLLGESLDVRGQMDQGLKEYEIAQELDPNQDHLSSALHRRGQYDRAIELLRSTAESRPDDGVIRWQLSENYARKGLHREWVQEWSKCVTVFGFPDSAVSIRQAFANSGYLGALRQTARLYERLTTGKQGYFPGRLAETYAELGDKDRAFYWLEQGCQHPHVAVSDPVLVWVKVYPGFASLRSDPRFKDVLHCVGLPP
jgi:TolB-like protein/DNA-binding winged helix-turn-helix (wHTH) protein